MANDAAPVAPAPVPPGEPPKPAAPAAANTPGVLEVIRELANQNQTAATVLLCALGVILVAGTALTLGIDLQSGIPIAVYVVGIGAALLVISLVLSDTILKRVILWFVVALFVGWASVAVVARPLMPNSQPVNCLAEFWRDCREIADQVANQQVIAESSVVPRKPLPGPAVTAPPANVDPGKYQVIVQFGGAIRRGDVIAMAQQLKGAGWDMQGGDQGGERTESAVGLSVIRYAAGDQVAAQALADSLWETGRISRRYTLEDNQSAVPGRLEIWIGQFFGLGNAKTKELLQRIGLYSGVVDDSPDGLRVAVQAFQSQNGLTPDGILGPMTTAALLDKADPDT